jgi:hypothetical protein
MIYIEIKRTNPIYILLITIFQESTTSLDTLIGALPIHFINFILRVHQISVFQL